MKRFLTVFMATMLLFTQSVAALQITTVKDNVDGANEILENDKSEPKIYQHVEIVDENGKVPAYEYYEDVESRGINVLKGYNDKIFLGLGNYGKNTGPVQVIYYDTKTGKIESSGTLNDEEVHYFNIYDGKLYTTGTDPKDYWGTGNYYVYNEEENIWNKFAFDNGWIHVFNMIKYKDKFIMHGSVKTESGRSPVQISNDIGKTFEDIKLYKYDEEVPTSRFIRVYGSGVYEDSFIVHLRYLISSEMTEEEKEMFISKKYEGLYLYDEETNRLNFFATIPYSESANGVSGLQYNNFMNFRNLEFNGNFLLISGEYLLKLYESETGFRVKRYNYDATGNYVIQNMVTADNELYLLLYKKNGEESFDVRISKTKDLENFEVVYDFETKSAPSSIEVYNDKIYVGTVDTIATLDENNVGALYEISPKDYLVMNKENNVIDVAIDNMEYPVNYKIEKNSWEFTTELNFAPNMTKEEWEKEFSKVEKMYLMYSLVDEENIDLDNAYEYYTKVLKDNSLTIEKEYGSALEFASDFFDNNINIETDKLRVSSKLISGSENGYKVAFTISFEEREELENPDTGDNIMGIAFMGVAALIGLVVTIIYLKRNKKERTAN